MAMLSGLSHQIVIGHRVGIKNSKPYKTGLISLCLSSPLVIQPDLTIGIRASDSKET